MDSGQAAGTPSSDAARLKASERELRNLSANETLPPGYRCAGDLSGRLGPEGVAQTRPVWVARHELTFAGCGDIVGTDGTEPAGNAGCRSTAAGPLTCGNVSLCQSSASSETP